MFLMNSNSSLLNCEGDELVVVVFGTKILVPRSEVKLRYWLLAMFLSALRIINMTYPLSSRLNGLSICDMIPAVFNAWRCFS